MSCTVTRTEVPDAICAFFADQVRQYEPTLSPQDLISAVNDIYHSHESQTYNSRHPEIFHQLIGYWKQMLDSVADSLPDHKLSVLDYGCGTGFALSQLLGSALSSRIARATCFDPSPQMLTECARLASPSSLQDLLLTSHIEDVRQRAPYDLVLTNSVLHHIYDVAGTIRLFSSILVPGGYWLSGHEPSGRFLANPQCCEHFRAYNRWRRIRKYFALTAWRKQLAPNPAALTAKAAFRAGLFKRYPPASLITRLVDIWVPHSPADIFDGRYFDLFQQRASWSDFFRLKQYWTYSYLGSIPEPRAPRSWQQTCRQLARRFPDDGANTCAVWRRT